jgi:ABC-2 type transport system ATP-binding protein
MEALIAIERLKKNYGSFTAVEDLSFNVHRNEIFGLLGPNGAGKTTTISMICGLLSPTGGSIRFNVGTDKKSLIGYCSQENILYPKLTCHEQLVFIGSIYGMPKQSVKSRALQLLAHLGLEDKTHARAEKLSGGMKRRLNIALALIHDPEILILDEPEAGLDPQSRILVRDFIRLFGKEKTVLLTTHNMDEADRLADRIAIMDHGKLLMLDTPSRLKKTVGEGDILEISFESGTEMQISAFASQASAVVPQLSIRDKTIVFRHNDIVQLLPEIKNLAGKSGLQTGEIRLRENSLEDVFIHLTGRNLRQ